MHITEVVVRYCRWGGSSKGMREFLNTHLVAFAEQNPSIQITTRLQNNKAPVLVGRYANGREKVMDASNQSSESILALANRLRTSTGRKMLRFNRPVITSTPSIQGPWMGDVDYSRTA